MATAPTAPTIAEYIRSTLTGADAAILTNSTNAAIWLAENECQRSFTVASAASARTFTPTPGSSILRIDDCTTVTSVVENGTTLTVTTDYQLEPSAVDWAGHAAPYTQIRRRSGWWYTDGDWGTVVVTATWGCLTVPPTAVEAMCLLAKCFADNRDSDYSRLSVEDKKTIDRLLGPLRRVEAFGIA